MKKDFDKTSEGIEEERYSITVLGLLVSLGYDKKSAEIILTALELQARREGCNEGPAILLRGRDSDFIDVKFKTGVKNV